MAISMVVFQCLFSMYGGPITFTVTLSNPVDVATSVNVSTSDGTALLSDSDYTQVTGLTLNFAAGVTSQTFDVTPTADNKVELDETFSVGLSGVVDGGRNVAGARVVSDEEFPLCQKGGQAGQFGRGQQQRLWRQTRSKAREEVSFNRTVKDHG